MSDLIAKGILSTPKFIRKETGEDFEPVISVDEEKLIRRYGELPESLVNKIASSNARNKVILQEYMDNHEKYGKTLIYAMNVIHYFDEKTNRILQRYIDRIAEKSGNYFMIENKVPPHMTIASIEARNVDVLKPAFEDLNGKLCAGNMKVVSIG